ncbi:tripartite tricarboxylate transporter substrate binding protein [Virgibacillus sp. C22-A2]|uniref:Tripartite tricarboxylate transporter substrate binding protein n=1 Tax=Virgibacillus tibetensis TaxID=3042313 RepID=A0ABU6KD90_9BACI|nr:tripartite tricarboxylate transporter substrate binding protein [Virgibacillus sp. C22-A2]
MMKKINFLLLVLLLIIVAGCSSSAGSTESNDSETASSGDYPKQQIKMIIPYGPGGATDIIFRLIASHAEQYLGQTIVPVNMEGASSTNGSRQVKNSTPDGYTILASHDVIHTAHLAGVVDYSFDAFEPIALLTQTPNILTVHADSGWKDINGFLDYVKSNPGEVKYSHYPGTTDHFFIAQLMDAAGLEEDEIKLIGYEGTGEQINALLAKQIDSAMTNYTSGQAYFGNEFVPLGVAYEEKLEGIPNIPTFAEQGIDMENATSRGIFAPEGTPEEVIIKIEEAFQKALDDPEVQEQIAELGSIVYFKPHDEYKSWLDDLQERLDNLAKNMDF